MSADVITWSFDPWRESPRRAAIGLAAALTCAVIPVFAGLPMPAVVALGVCGFGMFHDRLLAVECRVDDTGVERRVGPLSERRGWHDLRHARWVPGAVWLSPFREPHWMERFRVLELPLPRAGRDRLRGALHDALGRHGL
ncbi:MAG: hypothetical protein ACHQ52_03635 [Candidatus Eisenbacteria bacterium]